MAKRATMTAEHLETMKAKKPASTPAPRPEPAPVEAVADNRKGMSLRLKIDSWLQLKRLALDEQKPAHDLIIEGLNKLFVDRGLPPIA